MLAASSLFSSDVVLWAGVAGAIAVLLTIDLVVIHGRGATMTLRRAGVQSVVWVLVALAFTGVLVLIGDPAGAKSYLAGYLVEKSLSLDNVFVFLLVFSAFAVPVPERDRLLTWGIVAALVLRVVFILAGAAALAAFSWLGLVFAAILIWTGVRMWQHRHDHDAERDLVEKVTRRLPVSGAPAEGHLARRERGRWVLTTLGAALAGIALVDVLFAVDSVPAILAITSDAFIVFAANAFALLGLRPLFFLVAELVERLYHLKTALAVLLVFIGLKLVAAEFVGKIGPEISLPAIALILGTGVIASLVRDRRGPGGTARGGAPVASAS